MEHFQLGPTPIQNSSENKMKELPCHDASIQSSRFEVVKASDVLVSQTAAAVTESQRVQEQQLMELLPSPEPLPPISIQSNEEDVVSCVAFNN